MAEGSKQSRGSAIGFAVSLCLLALASAFAGAMLWPLITGKSERAVSERRAPSSEADVAVFLEHAAVDVRMGRGAAVAEALGSLATESLPRDPATAERLLQLWAEAATQAGDLRAAASALEQLDARVTDADRRRAVGLERIAVLGRLGDDDGARALAQQIIDAERDPAARDAARLRLAAAIRTPGELRAWIAGASTDDAAEARAAGLAALRLLSDPESAEPLVAAAARAAENDAAIRLALAEVYTGLGRPEELANVLTELEPLVSESERAAVRLRRAEALAAAGEVDAGLALIEELLGSSRSFEVRRAARTLRYRVLSRAGRLNDEIAAVEKRGDTAARAFIALEVERDYAAAVTLYGELATANPHSLEYAQQLAAARQRADLAEQQALYAQVVEQDPSDLGALQKYLRATAQLGEIDRADAAIARLLEGREGDPAVLLEVAKLVFAAGLDRRAADLVARAYRVEKDPARKQQLLLVLAEIYSQSSRPEMARQVYTDLAASGVSDEIREQAMARLTALVAR